MAGTSGSVLCEANLLHSATGDAASCRKKKHWWKNNQEAKGIFVEQNKGNYAVKFYLPKNEQCCHELPQVGKALILRHLKSNEKSLFIAEIKEHSISREDLLTLTLSFNRESNDFKCWEEVLRRELKVYSFDVEIEENQIVEKGPATVHLTVDYICITTNIVNGKFKALYFKSRKKNTVVCFSSAICHTLEIHCFEGHRETIEFQSKYFESIKKTLDFFEGNGKMEPGKNTKYPDEKKRNKQRSSSTENNSKHYHFEDVDLPIKPSRYSKANMLGKSREESVYVKAGVSSKPYIYSFNNVLDNSVGCLKSGENSDIYISSKELRLLSAVEKDFSRCSNSRISPNEPTSNGSSFSNDDSISMNESYVKMSTSLRIPPSLVNSPPTSVTKKPTLKNPGIIPKGGKEPQEMSDDQHTLRELAVGCKDRPLPGALTINLPIAVSCRNGLNENPEKMSHAVGDENNQVISSNIPTQQSFSEGLSTQVSSSDYEKGPKSPKRCTVEDWTPKTLYPENVSPSKYLVSPPKLLPRTSSPSLQPHFHSYENSIGMIENEGRKNIDSSREAIGTLMYFFGNEMERGGAWTIGVIVLRRDDNETLERLKNLESEFGRSQLTPPRSFDITSDMKISINNCSQGFGILGERSHVLQYEDMKLLGPSRWIVVEFHFVHKNEESLIFYSDIHVDPLCYRTAMHHSHFTSQKISVVKKVATSGSTQDKCATPPPRARLPLSTRNRQELCRDLDLPSTLGENWKGLAAKIGLEIREIRCIEHGRQESCTEEIFQLLEQRFPERCTAEFLTSTFREMRRLDLIEYFQ